MSVDENSPLPKIGWYIHHQGSGHLHRAMTMARELACVGWHVTGLSSLPRPEQWPGAWVELERDVANSGYYGAGASAEFHPDRKDVTAGGSLHFVPIGYPGLRRRSAQISTWIDSCRPRLMVVDVSVEIAVLTRLHGIPVMTVVLPGDRGDSAHQLGFRISSALLGMWPRSANGIVTGIPDGSEHKFYALGGLSRFPALEVTQGDGAGAEARRDERFSIVVLNGAGGGALLENLPRMIREGFPAAEVTVLGGPSGTWAEDPWPVLCDAAVVITAAGQNSIAEVAASRTPAVVIAHPRPYDEQNRMLETLVRGPWPVVAGPETHNAADWGRVVDQALRLDGRRWSTWCDEKTPQRFIRLVHMYADDAREEEL